MRLDDGVGQEGLFLNNTTVLERTRNRIPLFQILHMEIAESQQRIRGHEVDAIL